MPTTKSCWDTPRDSAGAWSLGYPDLAFEADEPDPVAAARQNLRGAAATFASVRPGIWCLSARDRGALHGESMGVRKMAKENGISRTPGTGWRWVISAPRNGGRRPQRGDRALVWGPGWTNRR
jgi:hypothetical protein